MWTWYKLVGSRVVTRYWPAVIVAWIVIAASLRLAAPKWQDIAADGDLSFLPASVPSSQGLRALEAAFPGSVTRSQMVLVFANEEQELAPGDVALALDIARHLHWIAAQSAWLQWRAVSLQNDTSEPSPVLENEQARVFDQVLVELIRDNLTEIIEIEQQLSRFFEAQQAGTRFKRLQQTFEMRSQVLAVLGEADQAALDADTAQLLREQNIPVADFELPTWHTTLRDVWSWRNAVLGHKLASPDQRARLIAIQLNSEFTATGNIQVLEGIETLGEQLRDFHRDWTSPRVQIEVSGSAAFGADMLRASAGGVRVTEVVTILLVLMILAFVYRAPFLVAIPLTSIALSLSVATSIIALLARDPEQPQSSGLGVFTTTRIFIVVILFGAGTDFCLFFLARSRELWHRSAQVSRRHLHRAVALGWRSVHDAIVASALTTMVGLGLMWFSDFEKFQFSGPIIAIALGITLLICLTFTPALLSGLGSIAFWPCRSTRVAEQEPTSGEAADDRHDLLPAVSWYWKRLADLILAAPRTAMVTTLVVLGIPAVYGIGHLRHVTYDLTDELSQDSPSRRGSELISHFFTMGDSSPITLLVTRPTGFANQDDLREGCAALADALYQEGVVSVRSLTDPLGDYPPGKRMGLFDQDAWRRRLLQGHRMIKERYLSPVDSLSQRVARFDVIITSNPFSPEASAILHRLVDVLEAKVSDPESPWLGSKISTSGTTAGITDLRQITQADQQRIQILVTLGVWLVLVVLLRQLLLSTYLILTVLLSYFATLGITYWTFSRLYAPDYVGLDWKVPLFLFVILVAVGQDYNVYLVTRVFEERKRMGSMLQGVHRALMLTGGIITSCGFVMAGTFIAMTSPAILNLLEDAFPDLGLPTGFPVLRGITELGFALALGVLLDTLIVRTILVPTFMILREPRSSR